VTFWRKQSVLPKLRAQKGEKKSISKGDTMNPKIMIIASGTDLDESKVESTLSTIPGLEVKKTGQARGITQGAIKVVKLIGEIVGSSTKIIDSLIEQATRELAGATIEIQVDSIIVKVTNANRSQLRELLNQAVESAKEMKKL
jgi:hypothetical protein